jgi:hypothetical protein
MFWVTKYRFRLPDVRKGTYFSILTIFRILPKIRSERHFSQLLTGKQLTNRKPGIFRSENRPEYLTKNRPGQPFPARGNKSTAGKLYPEFPAFCGFENQDPVATKKERTT